MTQVGWNKHGEKIYSQLDYIITNVTPNISTQYNQGISDHIIFKAAIELRVSKPKIITVCNRQNLFNELRLLPESDSISDTLSYIRTYIKDFCAEIRLDRIENNIDEFQIPPDSSTLIKEWIEDFRRFAQQASELRFTEFQGKAFKILRSVTKYDQHMKRDGSIISVIRDADGRVITQETEVHRLLIEYLKTLDHKVTLEHPAEDLLPFPALPPISRKELSDLVSKMPRAKALTSFPVPDELFKHLLDNEGLDQLLECWDPDFLAENPEIFICKLVLLNKSHPYIPSVDQMRPIVATNAVFKLIEARFITKLQHAFWQLPGLAKAQCGFLPYMSTHVQIQRLLEQVTKAWKLAGQKYQKKETNTSAEETFALFVDFEQAYCSIDMKKLHERMKALQVIPAAELDFIFALFQRLKIHLGNSRYSACNGVPQGGRLSPILFDFAMHFMLEDMKHSFDQDFERLFPSHPNSVTPNSAAMWADDLAFVFRTPLLSFKEKLKLILSHLMRAGNSWGLRINFKKSAIMHFFTNMATYTPFSDDLSVYNKKDGYAPLKLNLPQQSITLPLVRCYKYLGILINRNLRIFDHLTFLKNKTGYIINSFTSIRKASKSAKFCHNSWQLFIRPLLDYTSVYLGYTPQRDKEACGRCTDNL